MQSPFSLQTDAIYTSKIRINNPPNRRIHSIIEESKPSREKRASEIVEDIRKGAEEIIQKYGMNVTYAQKPR